MSTKISFNRYMIVCLYKKIIVFTNFILHVHGNMRESWPDQSWLKCASILFPKCPMMKILLSEFISLNSVYRLKTFTHACKIESDSQYRYTFISISIIRKENLQFTWCELHQMIYVISSHAHLDPYNTWKAE